MNIKKPKLSNHKKHNIYSIVFDKSVNDGSAYVIEEVRTGKKDITFNTMWKYPRGLPATQAIQLAMRANVRNDTRDIAVSIVENPKPRNSLYTVEAVDTNEKSSAVS